LHADQMEELPNSLATVIQGKPRSKPRSKKMMVLLDRRRADKSLGRAVQYGAPGSKSESLLMLR
jgi:hypothetical protein